MKKGFVKWGIGGVMILVGMCFLGVVETHAATGTTTLDECKTSAFSAECEKSYSCEALFQTADAARRCNYQRCITKKGYTAGSAPQDMNFECNCKYGAGGVGADIGIHLNTNFPFIGSCLVKEGGASDSGDAALSIFPLVVNALSKMLIVIILAVGVIVVIIGGIQWTMGDPKKGQEKIKKVAIGFALLGAMSAILALINPNFFK